jgi:hypothetical protein
MSDRPIILASPHGDGAKLEPQSYLGPLFGTYREAVAGAGARYVAALKANVLAVDRLGLVRDALSAAGFDLAVHPDLGASLKRAAEQAHAIADAGSRRLAEAIERLKALGLSLFGYQCDGVRWLAARRAALLADSMGLGKTIQVLMALPDRARAIVVAPAAVAANWIRECRRWRPDLSPSYVTGRAQWRWPREGEVLVTTYGSLPAEDQEVTLPPPGIHLVADEAHALKGTRGKRQADGTYKGGVQRVRRWFGLRDAVASAEGVVWLLTGTPLVNRPPELWRVLAAAGLAEEAFGSYPRFCDLVGGHRGRHGMVYDGSMSAEVPLALQKVSLRRDREAVLPDLPRKRRQVDTVTIADEQAIRLCDALQGTLEKHGYTVDALADMAGLAREVREVVFEMLSRVRAALAAAKIPALLEITETYEEEEIPVVVFSAHLAPLKALAARAGWALIDGSVPAEARATIVADFQAGHLRGVACSYAAGGVGITLTRAHHVVCVDLPWTPALLQQAEDRCCRIGQEADSVHVRILAADHAVDHRVAEIQVEKTHIIEQAVEASAVETPTVDDTLASQAQTLATIADETSEVAARVAVEQREREERRAQEAAGRDARARGDFAIDEQNALGRFRAPRTPEEVHAAKAMVLLAALDPDHAASRNEMGFSAFDGEIGHSLAESLVQYGRLSDKQWALAIKLAKKYRRQVGTPEEPQPQEA